MMMFETSKHVPKTEKRCCVFKDNSSFVNYLIILSLEYNCSDYNYYNIFTVYLNEFKSSNKINVCSRETKT